MYKVFFKDRIVFFSNNTESSFRNKPGLFYNYGNKKELKDLIHAFFISEKINHLYLIHPDVNKMKKFFSSCFTTVKASGGIVKRANGDFIIIKRNNIWDLPKGKNEPGEKSRQAALREVSEECGLHELTIAGEIIKTYHTYLLNDEPILKETTWFEMKTNDNKKPVPQLTENISEIKWVKPGKSDFILKNTYLSVKEVLKANSLL